MITRKLIKAVASDCGVEIDDATAEWIELDYLTWPGGMTSDPYIWTKSRLGELGVFKPGRVEGYGPRLWVELHVFNIHWHDEPMTPDERERWLDLKGRLARYSDEPAPARSDIFTGVAIPRPIDRVAHRVAPGADVCLRD